MRNSEINSVDELNDFYDSLDYAYSEEFESVPDESESFEIETDPEETQESETDSESDFFEDSEIESDPEESEISVESGNDHFQPNYDLGGDYLDAIKSELGDPSSLDYSIALEDLKTVAIFTLALILGLFLGLAFILGLRSKNEC